MPQKPLTAVQRSEEVTEEQRVEPRTDLVLTVVCAALTVLPVEAITTTAVVGIQQINAGGIVKTGFRQALVHLQTAVHTCVAE